MYEESLETYIQILLQSLDNKKKVMKEIEERTKEQEDTLTMKEPDMDRFEKLMEDKEELIHKMDELDHGFETVFGKIKKEMEDNKQAYRPYIEKLQQKIKDLTDVNVRIQALEQRNKEKWELFLTNNKAVIKSFKDNSQMASSYYKNMANQHQNGQSYFLNKKS